MKTLPIVQTLWVGDELSRMEVLSLTSYLKNGHPVHLYTYNVVKNVPDGVIIMDANEIISSDRIFKYRNYNSYAGFANLFRYKLLLSRGNFWSDLDVICLKPFETLDNYVFVSERTMSGKSVVNNCLIGVPENSEIMEYCYNIANEKDPTKLTWGETGPRLLTNAVIKFGLYDHIFIPEVVSTIDWWSVEQFISKKYEDIITENVYAIHLFNECWRRNNLDKNKVYEKDCVYESLFKVFELS